MVGRMVIGFPGGPAGNTAGMNFSADPTIALGWFGPDEHGICRLARRIAGAAVDLGFTGTVTAEPDPARLPDLVSRLPPAVRLLHLHVNDWLFADAGADPDAAVTELARTLAARRIALTVTVHDLPRPPDDPRLQARRVRTYRKLVGAAAGVVLCSEHERALLREALPGDGTDVIVIPLPIDPEPPAPRPARATDPTVAILGYLYPGKGHREVLTELAGLDPPVTVLAIGRPADRHPDLVPELAQLAARHGMSFACTGFVPDAELLGRLRGPVIPVAPHARVSASASIGTWLAAGRRPAVPAGRYAAELDRRMPGSLWPYRPGELRTLVPAAMRDPARTWLAGDVAVGPTTRQVAARYLAWLRRRRVAG